MSEWLEEYLIGFRGAILMVTHDRYFLDRGNKNRGSGSGKLYSYPGNYSEFVKLKAERQDMALATERKRKSFSVPNSNGWEEVQEPEARSRKHILTGSKRCRRSRIFRKKREVVLDSVASRMGNKTIELENISKSYGNKKADQ